MKSLSNKLYILGSTLSAVGSAITSSVAHSQDQVESVLDEEVVITGFRSSIVQAQDIKRNAVGAVDAIIAEDIADFPDQNLAESLQRIPGVAITRNAGEGREISVRGLTPQFTQVTLNGMQTQSISPSGGAISSNRGFDFSMFASELFQKLEVHKTTSAVLDEGSLGATVAMSTGRPLDLDGDVVAFNLQGAYNDLSTELTPRASALFGTQNDEGTMGALFSVAYSERFIQNNGPQTGRWENNDYVTFEVDGDNGPSPNDAVVLNNCSACQIDPSATATQRSDFDAAKVSEVNSAFHPRFPRVAERTHDVARLGISTAFQWQPQDATKFTFDFLYADATGQRLEPFSQAISMARTGPAGVQQSNISAYELDANGNMIAATMENVDVRSEFFESNWESDFNQISINIEHDFSDNFRMNLLAGTSDASLTDNQITVAYEHFGANDDRKQIDYAENSSTISYDMRQEDDLGIQYDWDLTNPANWEKSEFRNRNATAKTGSTTQRIDFEWDVFDSLSFAFGATDKEYSFSQFRSRADALIVDVYERNADGDFIDEEGELIPDGQSPQACGIRANLTAADGEVADIAGLPRFLATAAQAREYINSGCWPSVNRDGDIRAVREESLGVYLQSNFAVNLGSTTLRGNAGVRNVETDTISTGILSGTTVTVENSYSDTLPSINLALSLTETVILRSAWAKVMSRPGLGNLTPGGSIGVFGTPPTVNFGNPLLEPTRADAFDLGAEWYFAEGSMLGFAYFQKDVESFARRDTLTGQTYASTGLPESLLGAQRDNVINEEWEVTRWVNGEGGELDGYEIQFQHSLTTFETFPQWVQNFGYIANYTYVDSSFNQGNDSDGNPVFRPLTNQSPESANLTLYWENDIISARISGAYRDMYFDRYDLNNPERERIFDSVTQVDASFSYQVMDALRATLEVINLNGEIPTRSFGTNDRLLYETAETGRQLFLGLSYRM